MLDRIAAKYGRELIEHGIGFKYVCDVVLSGREVLVGGEESGGIGIPRHLPERDGILNSLLLANVMADEKKTLGELVASLQRDFGAHYYGRRDLHIPEELKQAALRRAADGLDRIGRYKVAAHAGPGRHQVLPGRAHQRQRRRSLDPDARLRHRAADAPLLRGRESGAGERDSRRPRRNSSSRASRQPPAARQLLRRGFARMNADN